MCGYLLSNCPSLFFLFTGASQVSDLLSTTYYITSSHSVQQDNVSIAMEQEHWSYGFSTPQGIMGGSRHFRVSSIILGTVVIRCQLSECSYGLLLRLI
jgi:hypothetical protein